MSNENTCIGDINVTVDCIFTVRLDSQVGSTGYSWALAHMPDSVNLLDISFETTHSHIVGCTETQIFTFVALKEDQNYLEFNLLRSWEPENIADSKQFALIIQPKEADANDLQKIAGCHKFASFGDDCNCSGLVVKYMPPVIQDSNNQAVNALYMAPVMKYMGPPVMKYMGPPIMKYMGPPVVKYMAPVPVDSEDKKDDSES